MDELSFQREEPKAERKSLLHQVENKPLGLKKSSDFKNIQDNGQKKVITHWLMIGWLKNPDGQTRYGCTASRKVGSAVIRNKLKRWVREYFRSAAANRQLPSVDINLIFRPKEGGFYKELEHKLFVQTLEKAIRALS